MGEITGKISKVLSQNMWYHGTVYSNWESLKKSTSMKQISLYNQKLCDIIKLKEAYIIDSKSNERKELNVNDYYEQRIC